MFDLSANHIRDNTDQVVQRVENLAETCTKENITRHALIIVGKAVEASQGNMDLIKSKLYDAKFTHGYRQGK